MRIRSGTGGDRNVFPFSAEVGMKVKNKLDLEKDRKRARLIEWVSIATALIFTGLFFFL